MLISFVLIVIAILAAILTDPIGRPRPRGTRIASGSGTRVSAVVPSDPRAAMASGNRGQECHDH